MKHVLLILVDFEVILMAMTVTPTRFKHVQFLHPIAGDKHVIVIRNDLDSRFDPLMFWNPLSPSVWISLFAFCFLPPSIMALHEVLLINETMSLKKFASRLFQALASNFGGNFNSVPSRNLFRLSR